MEELPHHGAQLTRLKDSDTSQSMGIADIESMTIAERLQAIELLWTSVSRTDSQVSSPAWHRDVLDARRKKVEDGKGVFLSLTELRNRLGKA
jgi:hypothetical protein